MGVGGGRALTWQDVDPGAEVEELTVPGPGDLWGRIGLHVTQQRHHVTLDHAHILLLGADDPRRH